VYIVGFIIRKTIWMALAQKMITKALSDSPWQVMNDTAYGSIIWHVGE
jgi:hypothetical protein